MRKASGGRCRSPSPSGLGRLGIIVALSSIKRIALYVVSGYNSYTHSLCPQRLHWLCEFIEKANVIDSRTRCHNTHTHITHRCGQRPKDHPPQDTCHMRMYMHMCM